MSARPMTPTSIPALVLPGPKTPTGPGIAVTEDTGGDAIVTMVAMASQIKVWVVGVRPGGQAQIDRALDVFARVESSCTRFDPDSALMRANAAGEQWCEVPAECLAALAAAERAHRVTGGLFDPRVLRQLTSWGYDRSLPFAAGLVALSSPPEGDQTGPPSPSPGRPRHARRRPWQPELDPQRGRVRIGPEPVDLGGIGKGLAVRWAIQQLAGAGRAVMVDAGGDCALLGSGPEGTGWRISVEDPRGGEAPVAVLRLVDQAVATSSVRLRQWRVGDRTVHHLVDPRTGAPGGEGLLSVTVVDDDPAEAEVWSKALFLVGRDGIAEHAARRDLRALWVATDGSLGHSPAMAPHLLWQVAP